MSKNLFCNKYIPKYCDPTLRWYEKEYDFIDLNRWENFEKVKDFYIQNAQIINFGEIYRSIGFKPINNILKYFRKLTLEELDDFEPIKKYQTVTLSMIKNIPKPQKSETIPACLRCNRKDIFITKSVVFDHFLDIKNGEKHF